MGIQGIYEELKPEIRVSLAKLAVEHFEKTQRPFRLAIDISIWLIQVKAARGGSNPAVRTLYLRMVRLLQLGIQPLFVFDGPNKPPSKRGAKKGYRAPDRVTKQMLEMFGYNYHLAPGEAEAECALLQQRGIVDAVLSEDVDTLMFGCGLSLRRWTPEGSSKRPSHVTVHNAIATKEAKRLDRQGMVLIAMMSGGDYLPDGIPHCGIKVACQAARAGFGASLCMISQDDERAFDVWRTNLADELRTNESKFFNQKHSHLKIPDDFPNEEVLRYYTHPVVSSPAALERLKTEVVWKLAVDIPGLRSFAAEWFEWGGKKGATKFVRILAPALLVSMLQDLMGKATSGHSCTALTEREEQELITAIVGRRNAFEVDGLTELRLSYKPLSVVPINLDEEAEVEEGDYDRNGLKPVDEDGNSEDFEGELQEDPTSPTKRSSPPWDPTQLDKVWILETVAKVGVPLLVEDYEESLREKERKLRAKAVKPKKVAKKFAMPRGALDDFVKTTKLQMAIPSLGVSKQSDLLPNPPASRDDNPVSSPNVTKRKPVRKSKTRITLSSSQSGAAARPRDPWAISSSQSTTGLSVTKASVNHSSSKEPIDISSSPPPAKKHSRSQTAQATKPCDDLFATGRIPGTPSPHKKRSTAPASSQDLESDSDHLPELSTLLASARKSTPGPDPAAPIQTAIKPGQTQPKTLQITIDLLSPSPPPSPKYMLSPSFSPSKSSRSDVCSRTEPGLLPKEPSAIQLERVGESIDLRSPSPHRPVRSSSPVRQTGYDPALARSPHHHHQPFLPTSSCPFATLLETTTTTTMPATTVPHSSIRSPNIPRKFYMSRPSLPGAVILVNSEERDRRNERDLKREGRIGKVLRRSLVESVDLTGVD